MYLLFDSWFMSQVKSKDILIWLPGSGKSSCSQSYAHLMCCSAKPTTSCCSLQFDGCRQMQKRRPGMQETIAVHAHGGILAESTISSLTCWLNKLKWDHNNLQSALDAVIMLLLFSPVNYDHNRLHYRQTACVAVPVCIADHIKSDGVKGDGP